MLVRAGIHDWVYGWNGWGGSTGSHRARDAPSRNEPNEERGTAARYATVRHKAVPSSLLLIARSGLLSRGAIRAHPFHPQYPHLLCANARRLDVAEFSTADSGSRWRPSQNEHPGIGAASRTRGKRTREGDERRLPETSGRWSQVLDAGLLGKSPAALRRDGTVILIALPLIRPP